MADPQPAPVALIPDIAEFEIDFASALADTGLDRGPIEIDVVVASKQGHPVAGPLEVLECREDVRVSAQHVLQLDDGFLLRAPEIRRVEAVTLRVDLDEFEEVAVDDEFELPVESLRD